MTPKREIESLISLFRPVLFDTELIRIGDNSDGGYLLINDLFSISACYSPGVGKVSSFERELLQKYGIQSHVADGTVAPSRSNSFKSYTSKNLSLLSRDGCITLRDWVESTGGLEDGGDLILQMDIEGAEYQVLLATDELLLKKFRHIIIEFHDLENLGSPYFFEMFKLCSEKLLKYHYVAHIHPNNCCGIGQLYDIAVPRVIEISFIRKDRVFPVSYRSDFPHTLDCPNLTDRDDLILPRPWFFDVPKEHPRDFDFLKEARGIIHVGANTGQERLIYDHFGLNVLWFEPIPLVFQELKKNIKNLPLQRALPFLLHKDQGKICTLNIANNGGASSSIYDLGQHKDIWPKVDYVGAIELSAWKLATLIENGVINLGYYDSLVLDTQGSELDVINGAESHLNKFRFIKVEAADFPSYVGACELIDLEGLLSSYGFREIAREKFATHPQRGSYYDLIFENQRHNL